MEPREDVRSFGAERPWKTLTVNSTDGILPKIREREEIFSTPYQRIFRVSADFERYTKQYFVNHFGERAGVLLVRDRRALFVRQYRLLVDRVSWEIPGGRIDEGEAPAESAARECFEETGVRCLALRPLISYHIGMDNFYCPTHIFLCDQSRDEGVPSRRHAGEETEIEWIPLETALKMAFDGRIVDAFSVTALLAHRANVGGVS